MRVIFEGMLYDTDASQKICEVESTAYSVWKTKKGTLFLFNDITMRICNASQDEIKNIIGQEDPEKYIELFGEVEEA